MSTSTSISARISTYRPGPDTPSSKDSPPLGRDGHVHEEVDVAGEVALAHAASVPRERREKAVAAVVHVLLLEGVAHLVALGRAGTPERVVAPAGVGHDGAAWARPSLDMSRVPS